MAKANTSDEFDYEIWSSATNTRLMEEGLWDVVENGVPPESSATTEPGELSKWRDLDVKAVKVMQSSLPESIFKKTLFACSAKEVWDLLKKGSVEAKVRRLEKQFEDISRSENESADSYYYRVNEIVEELRSLKIEKSNFEVLKKLITSSGTSDSVVTLLKELTEVHGMSFECLVMYLFLHGHGNQPITEGDLLVIVKDFRRKAKFDKWMDDDEEEEEEIVVEYLMTEKMDDTAYNEDMWMVSLYATIHMTRYEKFFTALDRTHKAKVGLVDGTVLLVEGKGDVKIVMKEGKKETISNVLFVPGIKRNVLSLEQLGSRGCLFSKGGGGELIIHDRTEAELGESMLIEDEWALRLNVIERNLTS